MPRAKLRYVPNPVEVERLQREAQAGPSPYAGPGPHVLSVGCLVPQKGFDRLLDAFARVAESGPDSQLWILGGGPEREALIERAEQLGLAERIHLVGAVVDPARWMGHAHAFVLASRFEGLSNALLEALACGLRSAAFNAPGGVRELLDGVEGTVLVRDGDVAGLARALRELLGSAPPPPPVLPRRFHLAEGVRAYADLFREG